MGGVTMYIYIYIRIYIYISLLCCSFNTWWLIEGGEPYQRCIHVRCILTCFSVSLRCSYVVFFHHISLTSMRVLNHDTWEMTTRWKKCTLTVPRSQKKRRYTLPETLTFVGRLGCLEADFDSWIPWEFSAMWIVPLRHPRWASSYHEIRP